LTARAGGKAGRTGSVVPCCQTLGPPNEEKSILGHLDKETFEDVYFGKKFNESEKAPQTQSYSNTKLPKL
jgi:hypothetical protein